MKVFGNNIIVAKNPISLDRKQVLWHFRVGKCVSWQRRQLSLLMRCPRCFSTRCTNARRWLQLKGEIRAHLQIAAAENGLVLPNKTDQSHDWNEKHIANTSLNPEENVWEPSSRENQEILMNAKPTAHMPPIYWLCCIMYCFDLAFPPYYQYFKTHFPVSNLNL